MTSLTWKLNRLRLMGAAEVCWRVRQLAQKKASKFGIGLVRNLPEPSLRFGNGVLANSRSPLQDQQSVLVAADSILRGRWNVFAIKGAELGFPPNWNRDPKTGKVGPDLLGKLIDYRSERLVGDIKYLWEPNRHLELVTLAQAWVCSGEQRYLEGIRTLLISWLDQCPYPMGLNWTSSLELAVRLLNWSCVWQLVGGADSPLFAGTDGQQFLRRWLDSIYQHCHFIEGYFSRHSSANNHLFGEYMGLFVASLVWPCWKQSAHWQQLSLRGLEAEALEQNNPDGVNKEQAIYYQHEVMDMMLLCCLVGRANGVVFSSQYMERLERLAEFVAALMDVGGNIPMIGDADDAQMVRLVHQPEWCLYRSLLASCAVLFKRADFKAKSRQFDDKNVWLLGASGKSSWDMLACNEAEQPVMAFPAGGYYLMGHAFGTPDEVRLVVDCAPLGYLSIAAHGHADALSLNLSLGGEEVFIDPGTYAYHTQKDWRDYFRSTAAHNTACVDHQDQSEIGGNFMWLRKADARLLAHDTAGSIQQFAGEHNGYQHLADPVTHRRIVEVDVEKNIIVVKDIFTCHAEHHVALNWQLGEGCRVEQDGDLLKISTRRSKIEMRCSLGTGVEILRASNNPIGGWISRRFDEKNAIDTLRWQGNIVGDTEIVTELRLLVNNTKGTA